jgi:hypothetical protein
VTPESPTRDALSADLRGCTLQICDDVLHQRALAHLSGDVIICAPGDLLRFSTLEEAGLQMEAIDVRDGEWTAWYATGQVLDPVIEKVQRGRGWFRYSVEIVVLRPADAHDPEGLLTAVRDWLGAHEVEAPESLDEALASWALLGR